MNEHGLEKVVALVRETGKAFGEDPRGGLWAQVIRNDRAFAEAYAKQNVDQYKLIVTAIARTLFDRDTSPGAEPEDLMRLHIPALVVPGRDASHATSAARYVEECLPKSEYWDVPVADRRKRRPTRGCWSFWRRRTARSAWRIHDCGGAAPFAALLSCDAFAASVHWLKASPAGVPLSHSHAASNGMLLSFCASISSQNRKQHAVRHPLNILRATDAHVAAADTRAPAGGIVAHTCQRLMMLAQSRMACSRRAEANRSWS